MAKKQNKVQPVEEIRIGSIKAAIWRNEGESGPRFNVTFQRLYRTEEGKWQSTTSFGRDDLLVLMKVADRAGVGRERVGRIEQAAAETTIRLLASHMGETVTPDRPAVAGVLPRSGERFQGLLPPLAERPVFTIRKRASIVFTLDDYVAKGILPATGDDVVRRAVVDRKNILVAGGTGSGKTTLVNAILAQPPFKSDRVVLIEDTKELQCPADDKVELLTKNTEPRVTMTDLLRMTLRLRPDRIIIGEVRGPEALAMLKAWNTGHPGGVATIHANSAADALRRIEDLVGEASQVIPNRSIASAINLVIFIERVSGTAGRIVRHIVQIDGFDGHNYVVNDAS